jgi:hypothetical protein
LRGGFQAFVRDGSLDLEQSSSQLAGFRGEIARRWRASPVGATFLCIAKGLKDGAIPSK